MKKVVWLSAILLFSHAGWAQEWLDVYNQSIEDYNNYKLDEAKLNCEKALQLFSSTVAPEHANVTAMLRHLSLICYESGDFQKGIEYADREKAMFEKLNKSNDEAYGITLYNLGLLYSANGQYEEAQSNLLIARDLLQLYHTKDDLEIAEVEGNLAITHFYLGTWEACNSLFESSISTLESKEEQSPEYANILYTYGEYCLAIGQPAKAIEALLPLEEAFRAEGISEDHASILVKIGSAYDMSTDFSASKEYYKSAIRSFENISAQDKEDYLIALNNLSMLYQREGQLNLAEELMSEVVNQRIEFKDAAYYLAMANLGNIHFLNKSYNTALAEYEEILIDYDIDTESISKPYFMAIAGKSLVLIEQGDAQASLVTSETGIEKLGSSQTHLLPLLKAKSSALITLGRYAESEVTLNKALQQSDSEETEKMEVKSRLAVLYTLTNQLDKADQIYSEIKPYYDRLALTAELQYSTFLGNYAAYLQANGSFTEAQQRLLQSIEIKKNTLGINNGSYLSSLENLGILYLTTGKYSRSLETLKAVNDIKAKATQISESSKAYTLTNLGIISRAIGDYAQSEEYLRAALSKYKNELGENHIYYANSANELGVLYMKMGNTKAARPLFRQALNTFEKTHSKYHIDYASALENLASLNYMEGQTQKSREQLEGALAIDEKILGVEHPLYSKTLHNLASILEELQDYEQAGLLYDKSLAISEKVFGKNHPSYANTLYNLAVLEQELEHYDLALKYFQQVVDIRSQLLNENHPDLAYSYFGLAAVKQKTEDYEGARKDYNVVIDKYLESINNYFPALSEEEKSAFYAKINPVFLAYQDFAVEYIYHWRGNESAQAEIAGKLYDLQLSTKALLLNASNKIRNTILGSGDAQLIAKFSDWQKVKEDLVKALNMSIEELSQNNINISDLQSRSNALEKEISKISSAFAGEFDQQKIDWRQIQNELSEKEVAIEILRIKKNVKNDSVYYAALINQGGSDYPKLVVVKDGINMELKYFKQYKNLIVFKMNNPRSYDQYWKQIDQNLNDVERIYLSSDGVYNKININTLYDPQKKEYVFDKYAIYLLSNTRELADRSTKAQGLEANTASVFGFPDYELGGTATASTGASERGFESGISALPGTLEEINNITHTLDQNFWKYEKYQGDAANEVNIKKMQSPKLLHIATHGFFMPDIVIKENSNEGIQAKEARYNPLFRSGLLLAGASKTFKGEPLPYDEDGILTAYEAMNLHLDDTELVIMSACETGLGEVKNGEGVYGLQRSFIVAGADNLVMSLWKVNDATTQKLMSRFYDNWIGGQPKKIAFRDAIKSLKKEHKEPYYWGAFVMLGN